MPSERWSGYSKPQRRAVHASMLRERGHVVRPELLDDPRPEDLIDLREAARMVGVSVRAIQKIRQENRFRTPLPEPYMRKVHGKGVGKGNKYRLFWRREQISEWLEAREADRIAPVCLNRFEIQAIRKLLRDLPDYGERRAREILRLLAVPLELESEVETDDRTETE